MQMVSCMYQLKIQEQEKKNTVTISGSSNLSKEDIEKMKKDAEANEAEDAKFKELVEARNQADQLVIATEKTIKENESKIARN